MIKRSPSRNNRSKGIKVKHVLQIILLLGVCFWLIYQVKHSHDKKKEFEENDAKVSVGTQTAYQTLKLGRKDLHPGKDEVNQNEKHEEEEEDDNVEDAYKHDHNEHEEEGNEHESEEKGDKRGVRGGGSEQEEDENKSNEVEDQRGGGDDEIDENDQEQSAVDTDHDEEFTDEEKEEESDEKEKQNSRDEEKDGSVENHNSHEAREENYKGDDASSAVTHDTGTTSTESETLLENFDVTSAMNITKSENRPNYTEESNRSQNSSNFNITEAELLGGTSSNATSDKETGSDSLSNTVDSSHLDNTTTTYSDSLSGTGSNLTAAISGGNLTGTSANTSSESNQAQNGTVNATVIEDVKNVQTEGLDQSGNIVSEENLSGSNSTVPGEKEKGHAAADESSNLEGGELENTTKSVASNETEKNSNTEMSETNKNQTISHVENTDATKNEFKGDTQTDETSDSVEHQDTDSSDSHILKNVAEGRTDLDTLPDIRNEGDNRDATATD